MEFQGSPSSRFCKLLCQGAGLMRAAGMAQNRFNPSAQRLARPQAAISAVASRHCELGLLKQRRVQPNHSHGSSQLRVDVRCLKEHQPMKAIPSPKGNQILSTNVNKHNPFLHKDLEMNSKLFTFATISKQCKTCCCFLRKNAKTLRRKGLALIN